MDELCVVAQEEKPDFILICESFCNSQHTDALLRLPGYQLSVRKDGSYQGRARGLLIYAKEELKTVRLNLDILETFDEGAGISVPWLGGQLSLVLAYRPPRYPGSAEDNGNTEKLAELIRGLKGPVLLCGDLNLPDVCWDQLSAPGGVQQQVLDAVQDKFWTQVVDFPTYKAGNLLDVGVSSSQGLVARVESLGYLSTADHQMMKFTLVGPKRENISTELVPDWTKANFEAMEKEIGEMDWDLAFQNMSGPEQWQVFKEKLNSVIDSNVPKKIRRKGNKPLWMKRNVLRLIRKKRRLWKHYSSHKDCSKDYAQFEAYKQVQNDVRKAVRKAKKDFEKKNAKKNEHLKDLTEEEKAAQLLEKQI